MLYKQDVNAQEVTFNEERKIIKFQVYFKSIGGSHFDKCRNKSKR